MNVQVEFESFTA